METAAVEDTMVFEPKDYEEQFDGEAYLEHFYSKEAIKDGTRLCLFALPTFAALLRKACPPEERLRLLDVGAGPTVYSAVCFRNVVDQIFLSDFLQQNLNHLDDWVKEKRAFDWRPVIKTIARCEGQETYPDPCEVMEREARSAVLKGGVIRSNVHDKDVLLDLPEKLEPFDAIVSVFCLESACTEQEEYVNAFANIVSLLRPGGYLIIGSVIDDDCYTSGINADGRATFFTLLPLTEEQVLSSFAKNKLDIVHCLSLPNEGVCFLMGRKRIE
ncbi:unnamed protein product [Bursaphelenchus xylophilus]|uniref:(pine wood nematode) hypothetical protein n=1 Tax=Bursaphelenchus xylophilus TaxID=6326 RepID=A0A1I7RYZ3_BURXY|nr:unnamed protein product [Bursaphelenchus xylophilus]CAG9107012.1 unnamed protein product [Bursaphelenchus xylophilus]